MMRSLVFTFLIVNAVTLWSQASTNKSGAADGFNPISFACKNDQRLLGSSPQGFPDGIIAVNVNDEGNRRDPDTGFGMVLRKYAIGQTEVTASQYCYYLNQVASGENYQLFYNEKMGTDPNVASIKREVIDGKNVYTVIKDSQGDRGDFPIVYVTLYQAARFCNWLQNQSTTGLTGDDLTERGAYLLDGKTSGTIERNPEAVWFIPTENEWYKSAYYKGGGLKAGYWHFTNQSNDAPAHLLRGGVNSANYFTKSYSKEGPPYLTKVHDFRKSVGTYNTLDMSGNVAEWVESEKNQGMMPLLYVARGGSWKSCYYGTTLWSKCDVADWGIELSKWSRPAYDPTQGYDHVGFRVATSLLVNSPFSGPAREESEFSGSEVFDSLFFIATLLSGAFYVNKFQEFHKDLEEKKGKAEEEREVARAKTADEEKVSSQNEPEEDTSKLLYTAESPSEYAPQSFSKIILYASSEHGEKREVSAEDAMKVVDELLRMKKEQEVTEELAKTKNDSNIPRQPEIKQRFRRNKEQENKRAAAVLAKTGDWREFRPPMPEKLLITKEKKEEVEQGMKSIDHLFLRAEQNYRDYKIFLTNRFKTHDEGLLKLQNMSDAYEAYHSAVTRAANQIKELFPSHPELWIPWHNAAMNISIEAMVLRFKGNIVYNEQNRKEDLNDQRGQLRQISNKKTLETIGNIEKYKKTLARYIAAETSPLKHQIGKDALQKVITELDALQKINERLVVYENLDTQDPMVVVETQPINTAVFTYVNNNSRKHENFMPLFYGLFLGSYKEPLSNLVLAAGLQDKFHQFLEEKKVIVVQTPSETFFQNVKTKISTNSPPRRDNPAHQNNSMQAGETPRPAVQKKEEESQHQSNEMKDLDWENIDENEAEAGDENYFSDKCIVM